MDIKTALVNTLIFYPFYGHIVASLRKNETKEIATAGVRVEPFPELAYNPDFIASLTKDHAIGVMVHEVLHLALLHNLKPNGSNHFIWNMACDITVNQLISNHNLPDDCVTIESVKEHLGLELERNLTSIEYYHQLMKIKDKIPNHMENDVYVIELDSGGNEGECSGGGSEQKKIFRVNAGSEIGESSETFYKTLVGKIVKDAMNYGDAPGDFTRAINAAFGPSEFNWKQLMKQFLTGRGRMTSSTCYLKESKRFDDMPGKRKKSGMKALVVIDTSGSTYNDLDSFLSELRSITKITGTDIYVVDCDMRVIQERPVPIRQYVKEAKPKGGGGTAFGPAFAFADDFRFEHLVYFTDGYGSFPEKINQRTLWVVTNNGHVDEQYGTVVKFKK